MPGKLLRRCTICGKFHASYLEEDPELGTHYLCYRCWTITSLTTNEQAARLSMENIQGEHINSENKKTSAEKQALHNRPKIVEK